MRETERNSRERVGMEAKRGERGSTMDGLPENVSSLAV
jgi:hypothetical protein